MPRAGRAVVAGGVYHVRNRGNGRCRLFHKAAGQDAFKSLLFEVAVAVPARILAAETGNAETRRRGDTGDGGEGDGKLQIENLAEWLTAPTPLPAHSIAPAPPNTGLSRK